MIQRIKLQHFRSIPSLDCSLGPITVLVGNNGSGKSNIVDSFRFLRDLSVDGLDHAVHRRGGLNIVRQISTTRPYVISLDVSMKDEHNAPARYFLKFSSSKDEIRIDEEQVEWSVTLHEQVWPSDTSEDDPEFLSGSLRYCVQRGRDGKLYVDGRPSKLSAPTHRTILGLPMPTDMEDFFVAAIGDPFLRIASKMRFASIYPNVMREPARIDTERSLREDCANWGSIIRGMRQRREGEDTLKRIVEKMQLVLPGLRNITVRNAGGYLVPQFLMEQPGVDRAYHLDPLQLSDGTLRVFGILLALGQKPAPPFLALEEPEVTVHPALLGLLAESFKEASLSTQLLITTHSPYLLDYFTPEEIKVVYMEHGDTRVAPISRGQVSAIKQRLLTLSETMGLDGLRPDQS